MMEKTRIAAVAVLLSVLIPMGSRAALSQDARISGQHVQWLAGRSVCVDFPSSFSYVGTLDFSLPESAGTRYVFAQTKASGVTRMAVVQAEHMLDSSSQRYQYPLSPGIEAAGVAFRLNTFAFSNALSRLDDPDGETSVTARFLSDHGLRAADQWLAVRYATYDALGRHEFLVFYMEPVDRKVLDLGALGPSDFALWLQAFQNTRRHAEEIVQLRGARSSGTC